MEEVFLLLLVAAAVYIYLRPGTISRLLGQNQFHANADSGRHSKFLIPEDSALRRHFITQLRSQIEQELFPRPTEFNLQRHYDTLVATELETRLASLKA
jgi:hypothetical protein